MHDWGTYLPLQSSIKRSVQLNEPNHWLCCGVQFLLQATVLIEILPYALLLSSWDSSLCKPAACGAGDLGSIPGWDFFFFPSSHDWGSDKPLQSNIKADCHVRDLGLIPAPGNRTSPKSFPFFFLSELFVNPSHWTSKVAYWVKLQTVVHETWVQVLLAATVILFLHFCSQLTGAVGETTDCHVGDWVSLRLICNFEFFDP